jgi:hypothetical protein
LPHSRRCRRRLCDRQAQIGTASQGQRAGAARTGLIGPTRSAIMVAEGEAADEAADNAADNAVQDVAAAAAEEEEEEEEEREEGAVAALAALATLAQQQRQQLAALARRVARRAAGWAARWAALRAARRVVVGPGSGSWWRIARSPWRGLAMCRCMRERAQPSFHRTQEPRSPSTFSPLRLSLKVAPRTARPPSSAPHASPRFSRSPPHRTQRGLRDGAALAGEIAEAGGGGGGGSGGPPPSWRGSAAARRLRLELHVYEKCGDKSEDSWPRLGWQHERRSYLDNKGEECYAYLTYLRDMVTWPHPHLLTASAPTELRETPTLR